MRTRKFKSVIRDKKGFSLVELIIIIAVMAILVGLVASQVIPYMEKSRRGKDLQQLSAVLSAFVASISSSEIPVPTFPKNDFDSGIKLCAPDANDPEGSASGITEEMSYPEGCKISYNLFGLFEPIEGGEVYEYDYFLEKCILFQDHMKSKAYRSCFEGSGYASDPANNRTVEDCFIRVNYSSDSGQSKVFMAGKPELCAASE